MISFWVRISSLGKCLSSKLKALGSIASRKTDKKANNKCACYFQTLPIFSIRCPPVFLLLWPPGAVFSLLLVDSPLIHLTLPKNFGPVCFQAFQSRPVVTLSSTWASGSAWSHTPSTKWTFCKATLLSWTESCIFLAGVDFRWQYAGGRTINLNIS